MLSGDLLRYLLHSGADTDQWKRVVISHHKVKLSNLHKIGKYNTEIGENSGKLSTKSELPILSIATESAPVPLVVFC